MAIYKAEVKSVTDETDGERIKVRLLPSDQYVKDEDLPYAFPLLPKTFRTKPKVGECVLIITEDNNSQDSQRYYIGPVISQPQFMDYDSYILSATSLLKGSLKRPEKAPSLNPNTYGCFADDEEVAVYSRGDTDVILGNKDIRIRCGARKTNDTDGGFQFNRLNPSYLKLTQHDGQLIDKSSSTATLVAENINLLSVNGNPGFDLTNRNGQITDEEMNNIIEKAHALPYGDVLIDFLQMFLQMFKSHTHKYANMPPCPDDNSKKLDMKYGMGTGEYSSNDYTGSQTQESKRYENVMKTFSGLGEKILSKNVRIN